MNALNSRVKIEGLIDKLLAILAIGFAASIPMYGTVSDYIPKSSVYALGLAGLFALLLLCKAVIHHKVAEYVRRDAVFFALALLTIGITTVKYISDLINGRQSSFFAYYAIPVYMVGALALSVWLRERKNHIYTMMQAYSIMFCVCFLIFCDRHIMDVGGVVRAVGNYSNPNEMSVYAFCAIVFSGILLWEKKYVMPLNLLLAAIATAALLSSQSRTAIGGLALTIAGFLLALLYVVLRGRFRKGRRSWRGTVGIIGGYIILSALLLQWISPNLLTVSDIRGEYYTYNGKMELIQAYPHLRAELEEQLRGMEPPSAEEDYFVPPVTEPPGTVPPVTEPPEAESPTYINAFQRLLYRLVYGNETDDSGILSNLRFKIWLGYFIHLEDFWLFGAENGFASVKPVYTGTVRDCHNTFLYIFVQYGLLVFVLCIVIVIRLLKQLLFTKTEQLRKAPYFGMLLGMVLFLLFNDLVNVAAFWLVLAILCAAACDKNNNSKKKIAIVRRYSGFGGIEKQIVSMCKGLTEQGFHVHLITDQVSDFSEMLQQCGAQISIVRFGNPIAMGIRLAKLCRENHVDILQTHMFFESFAGKIARMLNSSIFHVYRVHTYIDCSHIPNVKKNLYHAVAFLTDYLVDLYLPINEYNMREMRKRSCLPKNKIQIIHDGIVELGEPYVPSAEKNRIAMLANFVPYKGHDVLVEGLDILRKRGIVLQAYLYGGCPKDDTGKEDTTEYDRISALVAQKNLEEQVHFCGYTKDVRKSLEGMWAVVLPSYAEGTPNCVLEAMSLGILTISSEVGGVPEFITDGITGYSHASNSPEAFADAVERARNASDESNRMLLEQAYNTWQNEFSVKAMTEGLVNNYQSLWA